MPELPEVEQFRQLLLPLVSAELALHIEEVATSSRISLSEAQRNDIRATYNCSDVIRKGKQLCLVLTSGTTNKYLFLHMGMTGRIRVPGRVQNWGHIKPDDEGSDAEDVDFPPKFTYLIFSAGSYKAYFCDPRKFGVCFLADDKGSLDALAPDALGDDVAGIAADLTEKRVCVKALLLDQKRAVSGAGNWIADECLYQCGIHPEQCFLTAAEAEAVAVKLKEVVTVAVDSLRRDTHYPKEWMFHYRWTKKKASKDASGRNIKFVTAAGRTSAVVSSVQKLRSAKGAGGSGGGRKRKLKVEDEESDCDEAGMQKVEDEDATKAQPVAKSEGQTKSAIQRKKSKKSATAEAKVPEEYVASSGTRRSSRNLKRNSS